MPAPTGGFHAPAIAAHRLLGNGRTCALLRPDGEVDWWCAPEVDSPPLLWSLLDGAGGAARFQGVRMASTSEAPAGPTARTVLHHGRGRVECWDALVDTDDGGVALVRMVRSQDRPLDISHELAVVSGARWSWASTAGWTPARPSSSSGSPPSRRRQRRS